MCDTATGMRLAEIEREKRMKMVLEELRFEMAAALAQLEEVEHIYTIVDYTPELMMIDQKKRMVTHAMSRIDWALE